VRRLRGVQRWGLYYAFAVFASLLAGVAAVVLPAIDPRPSALLLVGAAVALAALALGVRRSRRLLGYVDPLHPLLLPVAYLGFSFLAPAWAYTVDRKTLLSFHPSMLADNTALLMSTATVAVILGLSIRFKPPVANTDRTPVNLRTQRQLSRLLLLVPLAFNLYGVASGSVLTRGLGQTTRGGAASLAVLTTLLIPAGLLLLLGATQRRTLLGAGDWFLVIALAASSALTGDRSDGVTLLLCLLYAYTRRNYNRVLMVAAGVAVVAFVLLIGSYRALASGVVVNPNANTARLDTVLADLSVATYTTGITAENVPRLMEYKDGDTYLDALVRQLPGDLANRMVGPPDATGTAIFRDIIGFNNANQGFGYSLPAEGYLNFGMLGLFLACFLWGLFAAWAYARRAWPGDRVGAYLYPLLLVTMPITVRSDALGMTKGVLYAAIVTSGVLMLSRTSQPRKAVSVAPPHAGVNVRGAGSSRMPRG
jgi:hypothetical protein